MTHVLACPPQPVPSVGNLLPHGFLEALEQNQAIASCCRHPEDHSIAAWYSSEDVQLREGVPDIYIFTCICGRQHRRFCIGSGIRPFWEVR